MDGHIIHHANSGGDEYLVMTGGKNVAWPLLFFFLLLCGCSNTKQSADGIRVVDVTQIHSEPILYIDKEIVSVELIPLETNDEFLCGGKVVTFTDEIIVYRNDRNGDILLFDRKGKALKKINRQGQGNEEYIFCRNIVYDDANKELFIDCWVSGKIVVYDLEGNFKRSFPQHNNRGALPEMENYDEESLIRYVRKGGEPSIFLISKQTGEKICDIMIPHEKRLSTDETGIGRGKTLVKAGNEFIISEPSLDTVYRLNPRESVLHAILYRTPPINTMNVPVFLLPAMKFGHFLFMFYKAKDNDLIQQHHPTNSLIYDWRDGIMYDLTLSKKLSWAGNSVSAVHDTRNNVFLIEYAAENVKGWEEGEWKEITANLKEDDNPVVAIVVLKE